MDTIPISLPVPNLIDVQGALRSATAGRHRAIEALLVFDTLADRARYARILQGFERFLAAWEPAVAAALPPSWRPWVAARSRHAMLLADLHALDVPVYGAGDLDVLQGVALRSVAAALGSLYVIEGSALGGQVIAKLLREKLAIVPEEGGAYFHGFGERTGAMWREFRERLQQGAGTTLAQAQEASLCAAQTFDALTVVFRATLHEPRPA